MLLSGANDRQSRTLRGIARAENADVTVSCMEK
jgi:hypothetical protein